MSFLRATGSSLSFLALAAVAGGCSATASMPGDDVATSSQALVFGDDDRALVVDARWNENVGVLRGGAGSCTAFAIGTDRIATAFHCLAGANGATSFTNGAGHESAVLEVTAARLELDYAELRIAHTFAAPFAIAPAHEGDAVQVVEQDLKTRALVASSCKLGARRTDGSGLVAHRCDTVPGASGGPVLRGSDVVAMHLGFAKAVDANVALDLESVSDAQASIARADVGIERETTCSTNCSDACTTSYNYPCPTWKKPGRTCQGHTLDPACKARCEIEREVECRTGLNGCDIWTGVSAWQAVKEGLRQYGNANGVTAADCVNIVQKGSMAAGAASAANTAYVAYAVSMAKALEGISVVGIAVSMAAQHGAECACRKALP